MIYKNGDYVKLKSGVFGRLLLNPGDWHYTHTKYGPLLVSLDMISHKIDTKDYAIQMNECVSCETYFKDDELTKIDNENLCIACEDLHLDNKKNAEADQETERELYHWGKM